MQVCKACHQEGHTSDGCTRDIYVEFARLREQSLGRAKSLGGGGTRRGRGGGWRRRLDLEQECQRLVEGFKRSVGKSEFRRTLHEMRSVVSVPDWQKSSMWLVRRTGLWSPCGW